MPLPRRGKISALTGRRLIARRFNVWLRVPSWTPAHLLAGNRTGTRIDAGWPAASFPPMRTSAGRNVWTSPRPCGARTNKKRRRVFGSRLPTRLRSRNIRMASPPSPDIAPGRRPDGSGHGVHAAECCQSLRTRDAKADVVVPVGGVVVVPIRGTDVPRFVVPTAAAEDAIRAAAYSARRRLASPSNRGRRRWGWK